jgi:DNA invertase Pin-like site-specific DNA recombinase
MRKFFYARISSNDQSLERQIKAAQEVGIDKDYLFIEKASGKDFKRPEYQLMKRMLRSNDILYIKSLDRLGRNKVVLQKINENKKRYDYPIYVLILICNSKYLIYEFNFKENRFI